MRAVTRDNITEAALRAFGRTEDARTRLLIERLIAHLHAYACEVALQPAEWNAAMAFLLRAGRISDGGRNEFILASDVLGWSSLVDLLDSDPAATERSTLGPFHAADSPPLAVGGDLARENSGERMLVRGRVLDGAGEPLPGALLDYWQAAANGLYWQQDSSQPRDNLRCRMSADGAGRYAFTTVRPAPYQVPVDGPVGDLLRAAGRHAWRPAHLHFIVSAAGHATLTTEVFFADDPYLDEDAVFGVRERLVAEVERRDDPEVASHHGLPTPFLLVDFDFRLRAAA